MSLMVRGIRINTAGRYDTEPASLPEPALKDRENDHEFACSKAMFDMSIIREIGMAWPYGLRSPCPAKSRR